MKRQSILIVDDDSSIRELLAQILSEFFHVIIAKDGQEALVAARSHNPSLILLDISMPEINGLEVCKILRQETSTMDVPIIMLTAHNEPEHRVDAFSFGADDFIAKPFLPKELVVRINRKLARAQKEAGSAMPVMPLLQVGNLKLSQENLRIDIDGINHALGQVEYKILGLLLRKPGQLVSREELNDFIWGKELPSERALDPHMTSLRKKLQGSNSELKTVYGRGFSIVPKNHDH